jgi:4-diphosphocytidyl-2-C-methyl-D-erythritol kinase
LNPLSSEAGALHSELAPAKINLALHVVGRRSDGYHDLDSIVAFAQIADRLTFSESPDWRLEITGPFAKGLGAGSDNLVLAAARTFEQRHRGRTRKYRIMLVKNLPIAAGLGGGSADAAACLRALATLAGVSEHHEIVRIAESLGADVPVCLVGKSCRMRGLGERIHPLTNMPSMPAVLVNPGFEVRTADVFDKLGLAPGATAHPGLAANADLALCRNDLTQPAIALAPAIAEVLAVLARMPDLRFARMSGSGATCFGIFLSEAAANAAAAAIARAQPHWWVVPTIIG